MTDPWISDAMAEKILTDTLARGRAAELLSTLMDGGAVTWDPIDHTTRLITGEQVRMLCEGGDDPLGHDPTGGPPGA